MNVYVLDACSLIAYLRKEKGREVVTALFENAEQSELKILLHAATLSEVYYDFWKVYDKQAADTFLFDQQFLPFQIVDIVTIDLIKEIGYFKTNYKISFADSFVLATAKLNNARIVTSDHHEFDPIEQNGDATFEWIR